MQKGKPIVCCSRKLKDPQKKHSAIEKELLAILETLEQFRPFLWGRKIVVYADHKNLFFDQAKSMLEDTKYHGARERPGKSLRTKSTRTNASSGTE